MNAKILKLFFLFTILSMTQKAIAAGDLPNPDKFIASLEPSFCSFASQLTEASEYYARPQLIIQGTPGESMITMLAFEIAKKWLKIRDLKEELPSPICYAIEEILLGQNTCDEAYIKGRLLELAKELRLQENLDCLEGLLHPRKVLGTIPSISGFYGRSSKASFTPAEERSFSTPTDGDMEEIE